MSERILTCVYCGHEYPQDTPASGNEILTRHISECNKHPMKKLTEDNLLLRKALIGLIGAETIEELEQLEAIIRITPAPEVDKISTINAIQALIQTY